MANIEIYIVMGMGILFVFLGLLAMLWASREEKGYYNALSRRRDLREFLTRLPARVEPAALWTGGRILIMVGLVLIVISVVWLLLAYL